MLLTRENWNRAANKHPLTSPHPSQLGDKHFPTRGTCRSVKEIGGNKMFKFSPLLIWYAFAIMNPFSWIMIASEKRCPTSMAVCHQADCHANLPPFQGARPDHVRVQSSSCCFLRELVSFDPQHVTRSPQPENVFELGDITMNFIVKDYEEVKWNETAERD